MTTTLTSDEERLSRLIEHLESKPVCVCEPFCGHWVAHARKVLRPLIDSQAAGIPYCVNCWHAVPHNGPSGTVDDACTHEGCSCGYYQPATESDAATQMRDKCVEAVKTKCGHIPFEDLIVLLESLTLDTEKGQ